MLPLEKAGPGLIERGQIQEKLCQALIRRTQYDINYECSELVGFYESRYHTRVSSRTSITAWN